ncbi:unnamed protein product [Orchesella dallaii]|uniref:Uncharacterized protein n=1 Tax=Orchesella dallaii TaxID=48710 RepID=A0ABP1PHI3_9HEXA
MAPKKFAIVNFEIDNSVAAVPSEWISDTEDSCYYPGNITGKKLNKLVKNSSAVEPTWENHRCSVMRYYDTFADASLYVKDALLTSDLSACEKSGRRKKKDKPSNTLPVHPSETSHVSVTAAAEVPVIVPPEVPVIVPAEVPVIVPAEVPVALVPEVPTLVLVSDDSVGHNPRSSNQNFVILPRQEAHHCNCEEFQKDVLLKLQVLEECFLQQTELLRCVLEKLTNKPVDNCVEGEYKFEPNQFPIKDMNSLDDLIQLVTDNKKAYEELVIKPFLFSTLCFSYCD